MGVHRLKDASPAAPRLTQQVSCSGCAAKIPVQMLTKILGSLPPAPKSKRILVGPETWDDAGVYRVSATLALVQTIDFFTPMVDDPYDFGAIAAANSVSDVYAMGGVPKTALSVLCFPAEGGDPAVLRDIVRGGADLLRRAGVFVLGGHSVRDPEIKFGYAVTGEVHPKRVVTNAGARAGDVLVLTKPLGVGILATALKRDLLPGPLLTPHDPSDEDPESRGCGGDDRIGRARRDRRHRIRPDRARPEHGARQSQDDPALEPDDSGAAGRARSRRARRRVRRPSIEPRVGRSRRGVGRIGAPSRFGARWSIRKRPAVS